MIQHVVLPRSKDGGLQDFPKSTDGRPTFLLLGSWRFVIHSAEFKGWAFDHTEAKDRYCTSTPAVTRGGYRTQEVVSHLVNPIINHRMHQPLGGHSTSSQLDPDKIK